VTLPPFRSIFQYNIHVLKFVFFINLYGIQWKKCSNFNLGYILYMIQMRELGLLMKLQKR